MLESTPDNLKEYRKRLVTCGEQDSEDVFQNVADSYEDDLLEFQDFPENYFSFVLDVLSDPELYLKPGAWNFLLVLSTEGGKLQDSHYKRLAEVVVGSYGHYQDADLCLAVCDFIARNYLHDQAVLIFDRLEEIESGKDAGLQGYVAQGRAILSAERSRALRGKH